jgi:hypothetical protein
MEMGFQKPEIACQRVGHDIVEKTQLNKFSKKKIIHLKNQI